MTRDVDTSLTCPTQWNFRQNWKCWPAHAHAMFDEATRLMIRHCAALSFKSSMKIEPNCASTRRSSIMNSSRLVGKDM